MFKKTGFILCIGIFFFIGIGLLYSQQVGEDVTTGATAVQKVDVGNKICPVTGEKINEKTKATYEYEGKIYNFCCAACIDEFKKDPDQYIKKIDEELRGTPGVKPKHMMMPETGMPTTGHEGMHH